MELKCNICGKAENDIRRMDFSKAPDEIGATITIGFFCINCGEEVEYRFEKSHREYSAWEALCE